MREALTITCSTVLEEPAAASCANAGDAAAIAKMDEAASR